MTTLAQLKPGQSAVVRAISGDGPTAQRIQEMGVLEGERVRVIRFAPAGDPMEIEVLGYALSLRIREAKAVEVEFEAEGKPTP